ncbi:hypothetical protein H696_00565 [Fonticula alba]|uniref:Uncharacterized protein n=1 Tax=Fonticula alba TaxID=691883 RepID=A0A058ZF54_FONAL|nr:hypothetical protein H696_00565 [Fonticula alba]KCV73015.1 hypothetical protein H696_00565 [Fonticula alba]|eukprot:XP_009492716.1 hypothetical protein H696_00565 [Fonticula alba]
MKTVESVALEVFGLIDDDQPEAALRKVQQYFRSVKGAERHPTLLSLRSLCLVRSGETDKALADANTVMQLVDRTRALDQLSLHALSVVFTSTDRHYDYFDLLDKLVAAAPRGSPHHSHYICLAFLSRMGMVSPSLAGAELASDDPYRANLTRVLAGRDLGTVLGHLPVPASEGVAFSQVPGDLDVPGSDRPWGSCSGRLSGSADLDGDGLLDLVCLLDPDAAGRQEASFLLRMAGARPLFAADPRFPAVPVSCEAGSSVAGTLVLDANADGLFDMAVTCEKTLPGNVFSGGYTAPPATTQLFAASEDKPGFHRAGKPVASLGMPLPADPLGTGHPMLLGFQPAESGAGATLRSWVLPTGEPHRALATLAGCEPAPLTAFPYVDFDGDCLPDLLILCADRRTMVALSPIDPHNTQSAWQSRVVLALTGDVPVPGHPGAVAGLWQPYPVDVAPAPGAGDISHTLVTIQPQSTYASWSSSPPLADPAWAFCHYTSRGPDCLGHGPAASRPTWRQSPGAVAVGLFGRTPAFGVVAQVSVTVPSAGRRAEPASLPVVLEGVLPNTLVRLREQRALAGGTPAAPGAALLTQHLPPAPPPSLVVTVCVGAASVLLLLVLSYGALWWGARRSVHRARRLEKVHLMNFEAL